MAPYILLAVGLLMLSAVLTHAWWVHFRVWALRHDLFEIRDNLWDAAQRGDFQNSPHYLRARDSINALIRFAPRLSYSTWEHLMRTVEASPRVHIKDRIPAVDAALAEVSRLVLRYLYFRTLTGFLALLQASPTELRRHTHREAPQARRILFSDEMRELDRELDRLCVS